MPSSRGRGLSAGPRAIASVGGVVVVVVAAATALGAIAGIRAPFVGADRHEPPAIPGFVEEAAAAGLDHRYDGEFTFFVGGGVAVFDCDDDGRQDLYVAGGTEPAALFRNESPVGGALRFARLEDGATDLTSVTGAYPVDIDGDRFTDLVVLRVGENVLLHGLGGCRFERANGSFGLDGGDAWTVGFSAAWEGEAAWPTLAFGNYLDLDARGEPEPDYSCGDNVLIRPRAEGPAYEDATALPGFCTLSMLFSSWDRSGRRDLRISNDRHYARDAEEQLWRIAPGEAPRAYGEADGWQTLRIWGMGIAGVDLTGDGLPDYYLTSQGDNKLQTLADGPTQPHYRDIALERGATAHRPYQGDTTLPSTAWHPEFADVNNDGLLDLFVSKGNVEAMTEYAARDPSNLLIGQPDGSFEEGAEAAGIASFARARGAALADLNLDGLLDLVVVNRRENVGLWRNLGSGDAARRAAMGGWLALRLDQDASNHDAIGAWVEVRAEGRTTTREVTIGGGHAGGQLGWLHFGLGAADRAEVRVTWPDGEVGPWQPVDANQFVTVRRGSASVEPWHPEE